MLPNNETQFKTAKSIAENNAIEFDAYNVMEGVDCNNLFITMKQYARWLQIETIKHCAEVATVNKYYATHEDFKNNILTEDTIVDKQSILNLIDEISGKQLD